jgi:hypothetical protein
VPPSKLKPIIAGDPSRTYSKRELLEASGLSAKTFDLIRKAARVRGPGHGGLDWEFSATDLVAMIRKAEGGSSRARSPKLAANIP